MTKITVGFLMSSRIFGYSYEFKMFQVIKMRIFVCLFGPGFILL